MSARWRIPVGVILWLVATGALVWVGVQRLTPRPRSADDRRRVPAESHRLAAIERGERKVEQYPLSADARYSLGHDLLDGGEHKKALEAFREAVLLETDFVDAYFGMARAHGELAQWEEAERAIRRAMSFEPEYAYLHAGLGWVLYHQGRLQEAEESYREAIRLGPHYADAHESLIWVLLDAGQMDEAEAALESATCLAPEAAGELWWGLGYDLWYDGRLSEAIPAHERAKQLLPDEPRLRQDLALLYLESGDRERAVAEAEQLPGLELDPERNLAAQIEWWQASPEVGAEEPSDRSTSARPAP
jgi:tetratricopeptide (TPR) repeat protein